MLVTSLLFLLGGTIILGVTAATSRLFYSRLRTMTLGAEKITRVRACFTLVEALATTGGKAFGASLGPVTVETARALLPPGIAEYTACIRMKDGYPRLSVISGVACCNRVTVLATYLPLRRVSKLSITDSVRAIE